VRRARAACLGAVVACAVSAGTAGSAQAQTVPFSTSFDNAVLNVNGLESDILDSPDTATITGDIDSATGDFTIPAATGLSFPPFSEEVILGLTVTITVTPLEDLTGTLEGGAGAPTGNVTTDPTNFRTLIDLTVSSTTNHCRIDLPFAFSTLADYPAPYKGDPFDVNLPGTPPLTNGAMVTSWQSLTVEPVTPGVDDCSLVASFVQGPGGLWLAQGLTAPTPTSASPPPSVGVLVQAAPTGNPMQLKKCIKKAKKKYRNDSAKKKEAIKKCSKKFGEAAPAGNTQGPPY
jgi:hypothetical protein